MPSIFRKTSEAIFAALLPDLPRSADFDRLATGAADPRPDAAERAIAVDERVLERACDVQHKRGDEHAAVHEMHDAHRVLDLITLRRPRRKHEAKDLDRVTAERGAEVSGDRLNEEADIEE